MGLGPLQDGSVHRAKGGQEQSASPHQGGGPPVQDLLRSVFCVLSGVKLREILDANCRCRTNVTINFVNGKKLKNNSNNSFAILSIFELKIFLPSII